MSSSTCYAAADIPRAMVALAFPFLAILPAVLALHQSGYGALDYFELMRSGQLNWGRQSVGWVALIIWIVRYFPPAWSALVDGPCLVFGDDCHVTLPGARRLRRNEIRAVHLHRGFLRKVAYLETSSGRISLPLLFVRASSDPTLRSLASGK